MPGTGCGRHCSSPVHRKTEPAARWPGARDGAASAGGRDAERIPSAAAASASASATTSSNSLRRYRCSSPRRLRQLLAKHHHPRSYAGFDGSERQLKRSASSDCVSPWSYACSISIRCSGGNTSSARFTARCCSLSAARISGLSPPPTGTGAASTARNRTALDRKPINCAVTRDADEPGRRRPERHVICFGASPHEHKHFLQNFLGLASISQNSQHQPVQQAVVTIIDFGHRTLVARDDAVEDGDVRSSVVSVLHARLGTDSKRRIVTYRTLRQRVRRQVPPRSTWHETD